jgi:hypothetical protein
MRARKRGYLYMASGRRRGGQNWCYKAVRIRNLLVLSSLPLPLPLRFRSRAETCSRQIAQALSYSRNWEHGSEEGDDAMSGRGGCHVWW